MPKLEPPSAVVARCRISGAVHGYAFDGELVQTVDGRLLRRCRNDFGPPLDEVPFDPVDASLDLHSEFARLRAAAPLVRPDHRIARLELHADTEMIALEDYPRPLIGDLITEHPADRLYAALWGWPSATMPPARRER